MTREEIQKQIEEIQDNIYQISMNDHLGNSEYKLLEHLEKKVKSLEKELEEM